MQNSIVVENLTRNFQSKNKNLPVVVACDNLSFEVQQGEIFGLLGPNGAGKTTLVNMLLGLLKPSSGAITLEGVDVTKHPEQVKPLCGFLPQTAVPMRFIEVERALYFTGRLRGQPEEEARCQTNLLLEQLGLKQYARRLVSSLSGGMTRMVNFGMALMGYPAVLVLDEPTNELDPQNRRLVWEVIRQLNQEQGVTCILVTHNVLEAEKVIQRVAVMHKGKFVALGKPGELKERLGSKVRLELSFKNGEAGESISNLSAIAELKAFGELETLRTGSFRLHLTAHQLTEATNLVVNRLGINELDDFRIVPPSLEDFYLKLELD